MKGTKVHVDLEALDREKRAKDPRTLEFMIAQKNATAHSAWKSMIDIPSQGEYNNCNLLTRSI